MDNVASRILRTQAGALTVITRDRACGCTIREGQIQRYIAGATIRQPVGTLLAVLKLGKADIGLPSSGGCRLRTDNEFRPAARNGNGRQIIFILLGAGHGGHDGVLRDFQFCGIHTLAKRIHGRLIRLPGYHQLEVCVGCDVHGIEGIDGGLTREQGVHVQIRRNQIADGGIVTEDLLHIERTRRDRAFNDLLAAMNAGVSHIIIGNLLECGGDVAICIHRNRIETAILALDHKLANRQADNVGLGNSQLGNIELARSTLRDDGGIRRQVFDVRPINVGGFNIRLDHGGHSS